MSDIRKLYSTQDTKKQDKRDIKLRKEVQGINPQTMKRKELIETVNRLKQLWLGKDARCYSAETLLAIYRHEKLVKKLTDLYEDDWNNPDRTRESLVEELASLHVQGVKASKDMTSKELIREIEGQQEEIYRRNHE